MMSHPQDANGKYLWWFLQSLEFHLDVGNGPADKTKHLNLGANMFDKPNKEAFFIVIHFLFKKLNPTRTHEVFRNCWPVLNRKQDADFRKVAFGWLQDIANEEGSSFPKVVASHLLSPSGPRFINLMLHLAKHVAVKLMKTYTTDGTWVPEAAAVPARSQDLELKRFQTVKRHFVRASVEQDRLIQDYQKRARYLEKSLKDHKAEEVKYIDLLKKYEDNMHLESEVLAQIHQKVQILWSEIDKSLSSLEGEQSVLDSVIQGKVDQYALDGKDLCVKIPTVLLERMERLSHQANIGALYEGGQLVPLRLLELLSVVLSILTEERAKVSRSSLQLSQQTLQEQALLMGRAKETLKNLRRNLTRRDIPQTKNSIKKLELDWEKKWAESLSHTSLTSFLSEDPVFDFISPMAPLSFKPATEASFKASIFSQYPAKLPESEENIVNEEPCLKNEVKTEVDFSSSFPVLDKTEDLLFSSCFASPRCTSPYMAHPETLPGLAEAQAVALTPSTFHASQTKTSAVKPRAQIMELEYDNLASQFAEAVIMSPLDGRRSGMELDQLLNKLSDPFTTKKQLPRTPESLIMDVRASWRKAVEEGKAEKTGKIHDCHPVPPTPSTVFLTSPTCVDPLPCSSPPSQQGASFHSTITWDSTQLGTPGQNSSNIIDLCIAQETFPDMEDDTASFNCGSEQLHMDESEREELELPPVLLRSPEEAEPALLMARERFAASGGSPFIEGCREMEPEGLPSAGLKSLGLSSCSGDEVFSLHSPLKESNRLSNLLTFSPVGEL